MNKIKADEVILTILFVKSLSAAQHPLSTENCGLPEKQPDHSDSVISERILNGTDAIPGAWPWQVEIRESDRHVCGGVLIAPQNVLTSAHCLLEVSSEDFKIWLGSNSSTKKENALEETVDKICIHPAFNESGGEHDIAIIEMKNSVNFSRNIKAVCLPDTNDQPDCDHPMYMAGWGYREPLEYNDQFVSGPTEMKENAHVEENSDSRSLSQEEDTDESSSEDYYNYDDYAAPTSPFHNVNPELLQQAQAQLISNEDCAKLRNESSVSKNVICASHDYGSFCVGDSGGPLVYKNSSGRWTLMGLVTDTKWPCNVTNLPMLFVRIKPFMEDFIRPCIQNSTCKCKPPNEEGVYDDILIA